jgi:hypothetical protein
MGVNPTNNQDRRTWADMPALPFNPGVT